MDFASLGTKTVPLGRNAKYGHLDVDTSKFITAIHDHIYTYGLRQILNDAIADKTDEDGWALPDAEIVAKAQRRLVTLLSGELRTRTAAEPADPVEAEMHRAARKAIAALCRKTPEWARTKGEKDRTLATLQMRGTAQTWDEAIATYIAKVGEPAMRKAAAAIVAERAKMANVDAEVGL